MKEEIPKAVEFHQEVLTGQCDVDYWNKMPAYRILVVDDEPTVSLSLKLLLNFDGHKVETVATAEEALASVTQRPFDLIITDYSISRDGMKGDEVATRIKQSHPGLPIIMLTAFADEFNNYGRSAGGADCVMGKPFSLTEMRQTIARLLNPTNAA